MSLSRKSTSGISLLELLIVLAIFAIIGSGLVISLRQADRRALNNASLQLQADLRYAQRLAIIEGRRHGIVFEVENNRYRIIATAPERTIRTVYLQNGVRLVETSGDRLVFLPRGTVSGGFRINLGIGPYYQRLTATVSGGRIRIFDISTTLEREY